MKVTMYMAISVNGYIAANLDDTSWVSPEDFEGQAKVAKRIGNIIYGKRTYDVGILENTIPVPDCLNIIVTHQAGSMPEQEHFLFTDQSPKDIITMLESKGFGEIFVAGGSQINQLFLQENLVDEIYLDVEPVLIGKGLQLSAPVEFKYDLEFLGSEALSNNRTIQLHYKVKK
jgi:dihydrofolate reductase